MIVPNAMHRLDAAVYKARYPAMRVLCPQVAVEAVRVRPASFTAVSALVCLPLVCMCFV